ncbi:MAG: hypothetical protein ABJH07_00665 [Sedimentitalea sp.]|uniref:hypothetical protein n=1 Tax=Sedimentitalea sp. TaxID=2048915 RepID=UPI0032660D75
MPINPEELRPMIRTQRARTLSELLDAGCPIGQARELAAKKTRKIWGVLADDLAERHPGQAPRIRRTIRTELEGLPR